MVAMYQKNENTTLNLLLRQKAELTVKEGKFR
jgi:hypothetical protein